MYVSLQESMFTSFHVVIAVAVSHRNTTIPPQASMCIISVENFYGDVIIDKKSLKTKQASKSMEKIYI